MPFDIVHELFVGRRLLIEYIIQFFQTVVVFIGGTNNTFVNVSWLYATFQTLNERRMHHTFLMHVVLEAIAGIDVLKLQCSLKQREHTIQNDVFIFLQINLL